MFVAALICGAVGCGAPPPIVAGPKPVGSWQPIDATGGPMAALLQPAVTANGAVILWGGSGHCGTAGACSDGARFDPANGRFFGITAIGAPAARYLHTAVWANGQMLVWGGAGCGRSSCSDGAAYDPFSNRWTALAKLGAPSPRAWHTAIFTGASTGGSGTGGEMVIWGGEDAQSKQLYGDGARYDTRSEAWKSMSSEGAPTARRFHAAVWTGTEMLIWGGDRSATNDDGYGDGAAYRPAGDRWRALSKNGAPAARWSHTAVWTGKQMIVWGGLGCGRDGANRPVPCGTGAAYDPVTDKWTAISTDEAPTPRSGHSAVWTGKHMIIWGGSTSSCGDGPAGVCNDGAAYDPATDHWTPLTGGPAARSGHAAAWTGNAMFIWGGSDGTSNTFRDGALYTLPANLAERR